MDEKELAKKAFAAGYKQRELDIREDSAIVDAIIEREFDKWWHFHHGGEE